MARLGPLVDTRLHQVVPKVRRAAAPSNRTAARNPVVQAIVQQARLAGVDPALMVAVAMEESGLNPRATGDQGTSFGLYQLHQGGALGKLTPDQAYSPATNAGVIARAIAGAGGQGWKADASGLTNYYRVVGRGSSVEGPTNKALGFLPQVQSLLGGSGAAPPAVSAAGAPAPGAGVDPTLLAGLARYATESGQAALAGRGGGELSSGLLASLTKAAVAPRASRQVTTEVAKGAAPRAAPPVSGRSSIAIQAAMEELGVPYSWGGGSPGGPTTGIGRGAGTKGFDCSALIQYAWAKAGVQLPRTTYDQIHVGTSVPNLASAVAGDLLFPHAGHVLMYLGGGKAIESPHTGAEVRVSDVVGRAFQTIRRPG